jgi:hypothetical protein
MTQVARKDVGDMKPRQQMRDWRALSRAWESVNSIPELKLIGQVLVDALNLNLRTLVAGSDSPAWRGVTNGL